MATEPEDEGEVAPEEAAAPTVVPPLVQLASALLDHMLAEKLVKLVRSAKRDGLRDDLADAIGKILDGGSPPGAALAEWLSEHAAIDDVFATDEDLDRALEIAAK